VNTLKEAELIRRRSLALLVLATLIALPGSASAGNDDGPANRTGDPLPMRVNQAIDSGVEWLKKQTFLAGNWSDEVRGNKLYDPNAKGDVYIHPTGCTSLALYTLLKSGVDPDDPIIKKGFHWLRTGTASITGSMDRKRKKKGKGTANKIPNGTYEITVLILALEAKNNPFKREKKRLKDLKFKNRKKKKLNTGVKLDSKDKAWMKSLVAALNKRMNRGRGWRYGHNNGSGKFHNGPRGSTDMSATQLALLALLAAERCGIEQSDKFWLDRLKWTLEMQQPDGPKVERWDPMKRRSDDEYGASAATMDTARGWGYLGTSGKDDEHVPTGSMTACGLANLLISSSILEARGNQTYLSSFAEKTEKAFYDGVAWLQDHWTMASNINKSNYHYYYLYCIERVGDLRGVNLIAGNPWYNEGAQILVDQQTQQGKARGAWEKNDTHSPHDILNTCFALLFLNRSTPAITAD
jgi:hypothetical protein